MKFLKLLLIMLLSIVAAACSKSDYSPSPAATYSISGTVTGASSVTINLTGTATATTTTDTGGNYSFTGLANGSYTVTPSKTGFAFSPASAAVSVSGANVTGKDFAATAATTTYSISGTVSGAASSGVTITLSGSNTGSVTTDAGGAYTISGLVPGSYLVAPSLSGFTFNPASAAVTITAANSTGNNFAATAIAVPHSISGTVSGAISAGVTMTLTGAANASTTTAAGGSYSFAGLADGNYTVTPSLSGYTFTPTSTSVTLSGADQTGKNFTSSVYVAPTYTLSGTVTGPYVEGVTLTLSGAGSGTVTTNASGNYSFTNLPAGIYTVTPSLAGYTYSPAAPSVTVSAGTTQNFVASAAMASYSISGTVSYAGAKTGTVYIRVYNTGCTGNCSPAAGTIVTLTGGSSAYSVRGLQPGNYAVNAEMDTLGTGQRNATNPAGGPTAATIAAANLTGVDIALADPATAAAATPTGLMVFPSSGAAFVVWDPVNDVNGTENVSGYKVYWGTDGAATNGTGSPVTVPARNDAIHVLGGLADGALNVKVSALNGAGAEGTLSAVVPVTIGNSTAGTNTVSGTVTYTGSATGPMLVGLFSRTTGIYFTLIASPSNSQGYSVAGVPNGSYALFAVIDMNGNGAVDTGDISNTQNNTPTITVAGNSTGNNITLSSASASATVNTDHQFDGTNHSYNLNMQVGDGTKRVAAVTLVSGANLPVPLDMGRNSSFQLWQGIGATSPVVGDDYIFKATFSDGTTQTLTGSVTAVLGMNSLAQSLAVQTTAPGSQTVPLFTWAAPASPPASYVYYLNLSGTGANWDYPQDIGLPSTTTQALYNADGRANPASLAAGTPYTWKVQVRDANGNMATRSSIYTP